MNSARYSASDAFMVATLAIGITLLAGLIGFSIGSNLPITTLCKPQFMISAEMMEATQ